VVFRVGSAAAVARVVAFVGERGLADDDFGAVGICGGMLGFGVAESGGFGAAASADVTGSFVRGAGECGAGFVDGTGECFAGAISDGR
jgi:hypothetical protein